MSLTGALEGISTVFCERSLAFADPHLWCISSIARVFRSTTPPSLNRSCSSAFHVFGPVFFEDSFLCCQRVVSRSASLLALCSALIDQLFWRLGQVNLFSQCLCYGLAAFCALWCALCKFVANIVANPFSVNLRVLSISRQDSRSH